MDFFTSGGFLGNVELKTLQKFGLGKRSNERTYDMTSKIYIKLGLFSASVNSNFQNEEVMNLKSYRLL